VSDRVYCNVRGCARWSAAETMRRKGWSSFICGSHWRRATRREKAVIARLKRMQRRIVAMTGEPDARLLDRECRIWDAVERRVAERPPVEPGR